ncbi:DUF4160 domain-containing protein [bacterium]|nr:DUF4160 domain-containing protein [bacterium]
MGKHRRGGYIFLTWIGDHRPRHVHIYKNNKLVAKWDLENGKVMKGKISKEIRSHLEALLDEGRL